MALPAILTEASPVGVLVAIGTTLVLQSPVEGESLIIFQATLVAGLAFHLAVLTLQREGALLMVETGGRTELLGGVAFLALLPKMAQVHILVARGAAYRKSQEGVL